MKKNRKQSKEVGVQVKLKIPKPLDVTAPQKDSRRKAHDVLKNTPIIPLSWAIRMSDD